MNDRFSLLCARKRLARNGPRTPPTKPSFHQPASEIRHHASRNRQLPASRPTRDRGMSARLAHHPPLGVTPNHYRQRAPQRRTTPRQRTGFTPRAMHRRGQLARKTSAGFPQRAFKNPSPTRCGNQSRPRKAGPARTLGSETLRHFQGALGRCPQDELRTISPTRQSLTRIAKRRSPRRTRKTQGRHRGLGQASHRYPRKIRITHRRNRKSPRRRLLGPARTNPPPQRRQPKAPKRNLVARQSATPTRRPRAMGRNPTPPRGRTRRHAGTL